MMESAGTKPHVQSAPKGQKSYRLARPGTDSFAIDVSIGATRGRNSVDRRAVHADAMGIKTRAVMLGGTQPSCGPLGECDSGFVVADAFGQGQRPGTCAIERLFFLACEFRAAQYRACVVDQQHAQVDVAALGDATQVARTSAGMFAWRKAECAGEVASGRKRSTSPTGALSAVAVIKPMPPARCRRWLRWSLSANVCRHFSIARICVSIVLSVSSTACCLVSSMRIATLPDCISVPWGFPLVINGLVASMLLIGTRV